MRMFFGSCHRFRLQNPLKFMTTKVQTDFLENILKLREQRKTKNRIEIKKVRFVNKRIVTYNKAKAKSILEKLGTSLNIGDVKGNCGVKFFMKKWKELSGKCL